MTHQPLLIVDNDELYLRIVEVIVEQEGIVAHFASSGEKALDILKRTACALMIVDLKVPGMNGYSLVTRARELCPDIVTIMVTDGSSVEVSPFATRAGISKVIPKPYRSERIREMVRG
jgi:DNA-binding NtrC family response regulator